MMKLVNLASNMRCEDELLLCCARVLLEPQDQGRIEHLLQGPLEWQTVLKRAHWHRIRPLTHHHLRAQPAGFVPRDVLDALARNARELAERNRRLARVQEEIAAVFEENAVRVLFYKGPTLTVTAYGDLNLRECGDLDLLVHHNDLPRVIDLIKACGFTDAGRIRQAGEWEFQRDRTALDVHWNLAPWWLKYHVDFDRLWEDGLSLTNGSGYVRALRPEDSLVVLSIHGSKHWWERLRWICDIAELVNSGQVMDWERVAAGASEMRSRRAVELALCLACDLLSARLPEEIRRDLDQSKATKQLVTQVTAWLGHGQHVEQMRQSRQRLRFRMMLNDRMRDRVPQMGRTLLARFSRFVSGGP
ncbi:MAG: nucleotidyltransferase family protein [Planctomycetota bacterium]|nr:nucleotidyltransferase family protein [Planctomycetota bacterium]